MGAIHEQCAEKTLLTLVISYFPALPVTESGHLDVWLRGIFNLLTLLKPSNEFENIQHKLRSNTVWWLGAGNYLQGMIRIAFNYTLND